MFNNIIATGENTIVHGDSSSGPASSWGIKNMLPPSPPPICYLWLITNTCTPTQIEALQNGTAVVTDYVVSSPPEQGKRYGYGKEHNLIERQYTIIPLSASVLPPAWQTSCRCMGDDLDKED
jgi:hypothetical protein